MAFLEHSVFCSAEEYERDAQQRVDESQLRNGDLYAMVMRLDSDTHPAAKIAVRLQAVSGKTIHFAYLDGELNTALEVEDTMIDGFIHKPQTAHVTETETGNTFKIMQGFFKDYFDDQFGRLLTEKATTGITQ